MNRLPMYQRIGHAAYRTGLDNTLKLDDYFNHPHTQFKTIHIAGTNGKGSVSHMLASILQEAGFKTGLYTSPHLVDFRERIKINGHMISKKYVTEFVETHKHFFETFDPSFFEISVFMAFEYFNLKSVDFAVIEVGLGGRLDATNIISPLLSVITNIGKDHTEILGDTIEKIAAEKAGIIKKNTPVVIGESREETLPVFSEFSSRLNAPLTVADNIYSIDNAGHSADGCQSFDVKRNGIPLYTSLICGLSGHYQRKNVLTVLAAADELNMLHPHPPLLITEKHIYAGLKNVITNTGLSGRWQIISRHPEIICDTAHNPAGIREVLEQVSETPHKKLHLVLGFVNDKNINEIFKYMLQEAVYYFVRLSVPRTMDESELASYAAGIGLRGKPYKGIEAAWSDVKENAGKDDLVLITGSNFLVADFLLLDKPL